MIPRDRIAPWFIGYALVVQLGIAGVALADPSGAVVAEVAEKVPVIALVITFSSAVLSGAMALFWKIYRLQANQIHELSEVLRELKEVLDRKLG